MTRSASQKNLSPAEMKSIELEQRLNASAAEVFNVIERARGKMTTEELERADREADTILENALKNEEPSRRRA
jgi:hypothetical protein